MTIRWDHESLTLEPRPGQDFLKLPLPATQWTPVSFEEALANPTEFPTLEKCATPDDRVVVAVDPAIMEKGFSLPCLLKRLANAGITEPQVTLLLPVSAPEHSVERLREMAGGCGIERHDPEDPASRVILGGTRNGGQIYLNRRLVEADLLVLVCGTRHSRLEESPASLVFPGMACKPLPGTSGGEVLHLLGSPYLVVEVEGPEGFPARWFSGTRDAFLAAKSLRKHYWHKDISSPFDLMILHWPPGTVFGGFVAWARAVHRYLSCLADGGRIVIISQETFDDQALVALSNSVRQFKDGSHAGFQQGDPTIKSLKRWTKALERSSIFILGQLPDDLCDDLQANKVGHLANIGRLVDASKRVLLIQDPEKCSVIPDWVDLEG